MSNWLDKGYLTEEFTSRDHPTQLAKFEELGRIYRGKVVERIYKRFIEWLIEFRVLALGSREEERKDLFDIRDFKERSRKQGGSMARDLYCNFIRNTREIKAASPPFIRFPLHTVEAAHQRNSQLSEHG